MRVRRRPTAVALLLAVVAACSSGGADDAGADPGDGSEARWTRAPVPEVARVAGERARLTHVLGSTGSLPDVVAGVVAEPGGPDRLRLWTSDDGELWEAHDPDVGEGHVRVWALATDGAATVVAGQATPPGEPRRPFVLRSEDRRTWTPLELPAEARERAVAPGVVHVERDRVVALGMDGDRRPVALHLDGDGAGEVADLPAPEGTDLDGFVALAAGGDTVVAAAGTLPRGGAGSAAVYRSTDAGATWELAVPSLDPAAAVRGLAWTGEEFVATGFDIGDGSRRPALWSSVDGRRWQREVVPVPVTRADRWFGTVVVADGRVVTTLADGGRLGADVLIRNEAGLWIHMVGPDWVAPGVEAAVGVSADGSVLLVRSTRNRSAVTRLSERESSIGEVLEVGVDDPGMGWSHTGLVDGRPLLTGNRTEITRGPDGSWERRGVPLSLTLGDDGTLVQLDAAELPDAGELDHLAVASDGAGATVTPGPRSTRSDDPADSDEADVVGWYRAGPDAPWQPAEGLAGPGTETVASLHRVGDRWVALGRARASFAVTEPEAAAVWLSDDGRSWARQEGPFDVVPGLDTRAAGACALPGGDLLVVGWADRGDGRAEPVAWRSGGGGWARVEGPAVPAGSPGWLGSCAGDGEVTLVQGGVEDRPVLWRTTDGEAFEPVDVFDPGDRLTAVRPLEGGAGFVAAGHRTAGGRDEAVVWLSPDGARWRAVAVPAERQVTAADVVVWGDRVVVALDSATDPEVWVLEDVAGLVPG